MTTAAIVFLSIVWMIVSSMVGFCYFKMLCRGRPLDDPSEASQPVDSPAADSRSQDSPSQEPPAGTG